MNNWTKKNQKKSILKIAIVLVMLSVFVWLVFLGGCFDLNRVKWHSGGERTGIVLVCAFMVAVFGSMFLEEIVFLKKERSAGNRWLYIFLVRLLN
jgi:hypothetical protein